MFSINICLTTVFTSAQQKNSIFTDDHSGLGIRTYRYEYVAAFVTTLHDSYLHNLYFQVFKQGSILRKEIE